MEHFKNFTDSGLYTPIPNPLKKFSYNLKKRRLFRLCTAISLLINDLHDLFYDLKPIYTKDS